MDHNGFLTRFFEAWNRHDVDALADLYAADAVMVDPTLGTELGGREAIRGYYRDMFSESPDASHSLLDSAVVDFNLAAGLVNPASIRASNTLERSPPVIVHIKGSEVRLEPVPDDDGHAGDATSAYGALYSSSDGAVEVGFWEFDGEQTAASQDGYEEVVVVLEGSVEIECDGATYELGPGDVIVYDCPIGGKRLRSPGMKAAYVVRYRQPA